MDAARNIAVASDPYAPAQDAASAIKLFQGELYYNTLAGVPYWTSILGKTPPPVLMKAAWEAAALTVPNVASARVIIMSFIRRHITGQVQITTDDGQTSAVNFTQPIQLMP